MNKRLMALAVAGALAAPLAASAEGTHVTIFGRLQAEYATVDIDGFNAQTAVAMMRCNPAGVCRLLKIWVQGYVPLAVSSTHSIPVEMIDALPVNNGLVWVVINGVN